MTEQEKKGGLLSFFTKPAVSIAAGTLLVVGFIVGILFWGGFNWSMEMTNTEEFCISCHEMEANVYEEYRETAHYSNRTGIRATCPDCHVPKEWTHKVVRKIQASRELYHHFLGTLDTKEKFDAKRLTLSTNVWSAMKTTDSRECRNCHDFGSMDLSIQENRASDLHQKALQSGGTCIDCHKGIAHKLPAGADEAMAKLYKELGKPLPHEAGYFK
ncbi:MAG: NapC/NirT family cytochrome c [Cohaesibacter sp.]|jgi:cytochrome c-type protein NapC|nr:NapC/NirT family cytochrome c [Cohaesibacter sp.]